MSKLEELFAEANVSKDQLVDLVKSLLENPMAAMAKVQELKLPPQLVQQVMATVMTAPGEIAEFAKSLGIDTGIVDKVREKVHEMTAPKEVAETSTDEDSESED
jgi:hypothetical protein